VLILTFILLAKKISALWLMIGGLLAVAYTAFRLSRLNTEFSLENVITPSLIGIAGAGIVATAVVVLAVKTVPPQHMGKVANFRSVASKCR